MRSILPVALLILGALGAGCTDNPTALGNAAIVVSPAVDTVKGIGAIVQLTATVGNRAATGPTVSISWTSLNGGVATVDSLGKVRTLAAGTALIVAAVGGEADTATLVVLTGVLVRLDLAPPSVTLPPAGTIQFAASGTWTDGSSTVPAVIYSATGGSITADGLFTAGATPGTFAVTATQQGGTTADTSTVTIALSPPTLTQLVLTPVSVTLAPAGTSQFAVSGTWSDGSSTAPMVTYAATGGTITAGGLYTAGTTGGTFQVIATQQGGPKADTSTVTIAVSAPTLTQLVLTPASITLAPGGTSQFAVSGTWSDGSSTVPAVTYAATGGTITPGGLYTADAFPGTFQVIATQQGGTKADTSTATITSPAGFVVNAGADQTVALGASAALSATVAAAAPVKMFWTKISGPGKVSLASERFNSTFDDLTLTDWIGGHQTTIRTPDGAFPDEVGLQGDLGNWYTSDNAPPTTDRPRTGAHSWKAFTPYDSNHSAKLLKWNLDYLEAYFSVWVYWPSSEIVGGHGSGGFINYLNLMQWKERSSPWNPTWVIAVTGLSAGVDQFAIHDWYNNQPIVRTGVPVPKDQWFNLTGYMKEGFGTSGELTVWLNHALIYHQSGINTLGGATNTTAHLMWGIGNYSNALVGQGEQSIYFADVTVTPAADVTKTTATFAAPGTYVLRLTAYDGTSNASDDVTITVR